VTIRGGKKRGARICFWGASTTRQREEKRIYCSQKQMRHGATPQESTTEGRKQETGKKNSWARAGGGAEFAIGARSSPHAWEKGAGRGGQKKKRKGKNTTVGCLRNGHSARVRGGGKGRGLDVANEKGEASQKKTERGTVKDRERKKNTSTSQRGKSQKLG